MVDTKAFQTKTIYQEYPSSQSNSRWIIGLDVGYSSVKGMSGNAYYCFPSYVMKVPEDRVSVKEPEDTDIRYRDETGTWVVGNLAYLEATETDVIVSEAEMQGRHWYNSDRFRISTAVGLAMGMNVNSYGNPEKPADKKLVVQTGLPPKRRKADTAELKEAMAHDYDFDLKIGKKDWKHYHFTLSERNIHVTDQAFGALISAAVDKRGESIAAAKNYFSSNVLVFDPGFVTVDNYTVVRGEIVRCETFENLGMYEVFKRTCQEISDKFGREVHVAELQTVLDTGLIKIWNKKKMSSQLYDFREILEKNCMTVCGEAIEKMKVVHDYFTRVDYIVATGGTYEAWKSYFDHVFDQMEGLQIIPANINEPALSNIFSNVRGYYFYRLNS